MHSFILVVSRLYYPQLRAILPASCLVFAVQSLSHVQFLVTPWTTLCQASLPLLAPRICSNSYPLSRWCHPCHPCLPVMSTSSSVTLFSSCPQSFPASGSFSRSQLFSSGDQSIGVSDSVSVLPITIHGWFPFGLTGLISLLPKGLSSVFFSTTAWKHQFLGT